MAPYKVTLKLYQRSVILEVVPQISMNSQDQPEEEGVNSASGIPPNGMGMPVGE